MTTPGDENMLDKVQNYRKIVLIYEGLNQKINALLEMNNGATENMSTDDFDQYRIWARQRDELQNEMRQIEQQLLDDDNTQ